MKVKPTRTNAKRIKKTLVTFNSTRTGKHVFLVDAEVDENGTARIPYSLLLELQSKAKIGSNELFSWN